MFVWEVDNRRHVYAGGGPPRVIGDVRRESGLEVSSCLRNPGASTLVTIPGEPELCARVTLLEMNIIPLVLDKGLYSVLSRARLLGHDCYNDAKKIALIKQIPDRSLVHATENRGLDKDKVEA